MIDHNRARSNLGKVLKWEGDAFAEERDEIAFLTASAILSTFSYKDCH